MRKRATVKTEFDMTNEFSKRLQISLSNKTKLKNEAQGICPCASLFELRLKSGAD